MSHPNNNNLPPSRPYWPIFSGLSTNKRIYVPYRGRPLCRNCYQFLPFHTGWCVATDSELEEDAEDIEEDSDPSDVSDVDTEVMEEDEEWEDFVAPEDEDLVEDESTNANQEEFEYATVLLSTPPSTPICKE